MKRLLFIVSLLTLLVPTLAQDVNQVSPDDFLEIARVLPPIETVVITEENDQPMLLIYGQMADTCELDNVVHVTKQRQGPVLFVDVYDDPVPPSTVPCPDKIIPMALTVSAEEVLTLDDEATLPTFLAVNDHYYRINIAQMEPVGTPPAVPPMMLTPLKRTYASVDAITPEEGTDGLTELRIEGRLPTGCADTPVTRLIPASPEKTNYLIDVFQLLDDPQMCPDTYVAVHYEITVKTPVAFDPQMTFTAIAHDPAADQTPIPVPPNGEKTMRVPHVIESVEAMLLESYPVQIHLTVKGYQPDGCSAPVQTTQSRSGNTVTVEIFRELPPDTMCPMMIETYEATVKLEGGFESGTYTIDVNGTVITVKI